MSPYQSPSTYVTGYVPAAAAARIPACRFSAHRWRARRGTVLRVALAVIVLAVLVALILPRQYTSSAVVMLDQRKNNFTDLSAVLSQLPTDPATLQNQIQILTSRDIAPTSSPNCSFTTIRNSIRRWSRPARPPCCG